MKYENTAIDVINENYYAISNIQKSPERFVLLIKLNSYDNNPEHFRISFVTSLTKWNPAFAQDRLAALKQDIPKHPERFLPEFLHQVQKNPLMVLLQNTQVITDPSILHFFDQLLMADLPQFTISLLYKTDKQQAAPYLNPANCYLTEAEEMQYYELENMDFNEDDFRKIRACTDGWRAAVQIIPQIYHQHGTIFCSHPDRYFNQWARDFYLKQYTQPEIERLMCISLLEEFSLPLCQHLFTWNGENLPMILGDSPVLRYHPKNRKYAFAACLHPYLKEKQVLLGNRLKQDFYIQIGQWYEEREDILLAIHYYKLAGANKEILEIMKKWMFPNSRERASCFVNVISDMPAAFLDKNPLLHVIRAHMLCTLYRYQDAYQLMNEFVLKMDQGQTVSAKIRPVLGEAYLLLGHTALTVVKDQDTVLNFFQRAAELLPDGSSMIQGKLNMFADTPVIRLVSREKGALHWCLERIALFEPLLTKITNGGWAGGSYLAAAELHYYTRDFAEVEYNARKAIVKAQKQEQYDITCSAWFLLMRLHFAKGNYRKTMECYRLLCQYAAEANYKSFFSMPDLASSWLMLKTGQKHEVADWLKDESIYQRTIMPWNYGRDRVIRSYYLLVNEEYESVIAYTSGSIELLRMRSSNLLIIQLMMMQAVSYNLLGNTAEAVKVFESVYQWCHPNEIIMPVVEYGKHIRKLVDSCRQTPGCTIPGEWLELVKKYAHNYSVYQYNIRKQFEYQHEKKDSPLADLTTAELKTLHLIYQGHSTREIAGLQGKSFDTVRGTIKRIYAKINASSRVDAVRIAAENGMKEMES